MSRYDSILSELQQRGGSITVARRAMTRIFAESTSPLSAVQVLTLMKKIGVRVNKTTVYRELRFLEEKNIIRAMQFEERIRRYELRPSDHRHHLICTTCKKIDDVVLHHDLDHVEKSLCDLKGFYVEKHALEFYGVCKECR